MRVLAGVMVGYGTYVGVTDGAAGLISLAPILVIHALVAAVFLSVGRYRKRSRSRGHDSAGGTRPETCESQLAALARDS